MKERELVEPTMGEDMSTAEGRVFKKDPMINVISKEDFEDRIEKVFHILWKTLAKSFGPYGAPTMIYNYPWSHVTKDGFTIMKNLSMDVSETIVDQAIANMASDICGRLNVNVGDGTTSAVIATNSIYQQYRFHREALKRFHVLPRDIMNYFEDIKKEVSEALPSHIRPIRSSDMDELSRNIRDVVYISSNGDQVITDAISDLYKELGSPAITVELAEDGITKKKLIDGYQYKVALMDKLYINNDKNTMQLKNADVIIFTTKISMPIYDKILKPLSILSMQRERHLIVCAPAYDEILVTQKVIHELDAEFRQRKDINMVLMQYRAISAHTRKLIEDFAVLANTTTINLNLSNEIIKKIDAGSDIVELFNIDSRDGIGNTYRIAYNIEASNGMRYRTDDELKEAREKGYTPINELCPLDNNNIRIGYVGECELGMKKSLFKELYPNKEKYKVILKDAEDTLKEVEAKYAALGTFNLEVSQAQERLYALKLKMGSIEVGGDSELSQKLLKDAVDDAVKAAASAYNYGVVLGCNTNLIQVLNNIMTSHNNMAHTTGDKTESVKALMASILLHGFIDVYDTVLSNAFEDITIYSKEDVSDSHFTIDQSVYAKIKETFDRELYINSDDIFDDEKLFEDAVAYASDIDGKITIHNIIIFYGIFSDKVFDVSKWNYAEDVINSAQTDEEILKATIDLISLLIVGNQMVVTQKHNF